MHEIFYQSIDVLLFRLWLDPFQVVPQPEQHDYTRYIFC